MSGICLVVAASLVGGYASLNAFCDITQRTSSTAYSASVGRNAEWVGSVNSQFDQTQIDDLVSDNSYVVIEKFHDNWNLAAQFAAARALKAEAQKQGRSLKVYAYFNSSIWFSINNTGWGSFAASFKNSYLLKDSKGQTIPYYGLFRSANTEDEDDDPTGRLVDLSNPAYRNWAVNTLVQWMKDAPFDGVAFDTANPMLADTPLRASISTGPSQTPAQLLCGTDTSTCERVTAWNDGLTSMLSTATKTLNGMGHDVIYNGVADNPQRVDRNVALLSDTNGAANENFCYTSQLKNASAVDFTPLRDDITMMQTAARNQKTLVEITNYVDDPRLKYGAYCLGGFLMGWEPGAAYWVYHTGYRDPLTENRQLPEVNLDLGTPSGDYSATGDLLTRQFARGFVAVNDGDDSVTVQVPYGVDQYAGGKVVASWKAGSTLSLTGHDAAFFLRSDPSTFRSTVTSVCHAV